MQKLMNRTLVLGTTLLAVVLLASCGSKQTPDPITQQAPAFLPNYSLLKPMPSPGEGMKVYAYKDPSVNRGDYNAAIVAPVIIYQTATDKGVTDSQIEQARANINTGIQQIVNKKLKLTNQAGLGVLRLQVAITGASAAEDGFSARNIIPVSAAIKLASMATGMDSKTPQLIVELKFTDSQTGKLLKEVVTTIDGEKFRQTSNTTGEFSKLATEWVQQAMKYSR